MKSSHWRAWLGAALIFLLGAIVGGTVVTRLGMARLRQALQGGAVGTTFAERATDRIADDLIQELDLNGEQARRLRLTLDSTAANLRQVRRRATVEVAGEIRSSLQQIGADLPPEKRVKFREVMRKRFEKLGLPSPETSPDK
ncbi:MAG TPA: hypothetical protein PLN52_20860 [Opitutaceae bacterium]|nr:hypothetical protein [Opitutaceae bacterium]